MYSKNRLVGNIHSWLLGVAAVLLFAGGLLIANEGESSGGGLEVSVMSFNIRYGTANDGANRWVNRREMVFEVVRKHRPDVVGLQEALGYQIDEICKAVPGYARIGVGREDGKTEGEFSAILYRRDKFEVKQNGTFWLSDTPEVPGSITWGNACTRICTWGRFQEKNTGRAFYLYNLHLDHVSQPSREKSMILLVKRIVGRKRPDPFVVTGDFNAGEKNPAILLLKGKDKADSANPIPMVDTFRVLHGDAKKVGTFNGFKGTDTGGKIDYVLTTSDVRVLDAQILHDNDDGRYPSDHFPVTARLRFSAGTTYYIDGSNGADENAGTSAEKPWKSLDPVNARVFEAGDTILFKAGTAYAGRLKVQGSGSEENPIVVDMYGKGLKPRIDGEGIQDTVLIENVEYWELNNLEITNLGETRADWRTGVRVSANDYGTIHHIHLRNLYVHDVNGSNKKSREGCGIFFESKGRKPSRFDDLLIEDCRLVRTDRNGICGRSSFINRQRNWYPSLNVVIRGNLLEDIGGDCIKPWGCDGCIVEHNVVRGGRRRAEDAAAGIWPWSCDNTVIQYNEVSGMKGTKDGQGFDSDYNSRNSLFQYNYSHDNDGARIFHIGGPVSNTRIYNNVFNVPKGRDILAVYCTDWGGWAKNTHLYNNIFYVEGKLRYEFGQSTGNEFSHNVFYGKNENRPDDPHAILKNPMFINPGRGDGIDSLDGYKLSQTSPCIDAGKSIENRPDRDFRGNKLVQDQAIDIGAFEIR